jgi:hypothetical protein
MSKQTTFRSKYEVALYHVDILNIYLSEVENTSSYTIKYFYLRLHKKLSTIFVTNFICLVIVFHYILALSLKCNKSS